MAKNIEYENEIQRMLKAVSMITQEIETLKKQQQEQADVRAQAIAQAKANGLPEPVLEPELPIRDNRAPLTSDEKQRLSARINALPTDKLAKVVDIIHDRVPSLKKLVDLVEVEIDLGSLDTSTSFCIQCFHFSGTLRLLDRFTRANTMQVLSPTSNGEHIFSPGRPQVAYSPYPAEHNIGDTNIVASTSASPPDQGSSSDSQSSSDSFSESSDSESGNESNVAHVHLPMAFLTQVDTFCWLKHVNSPLHSI